MNFKSAKQQKGFTLIELIIVIIILGILAVTAAPKFIDIQDDAKAETVQAVVAALKSANLAVNGKARISNQDDATGSVTVNGTSVSVANAYPDDVADLTTLLDIADLTPVFSSGDGGAVGGAAGTPGEGRSAILLYGYDDDSAFDYSGIAATSDVCLVLYAETTDANVAPTVTAYTAGC